MLVACEQQQAAEVPQPVPRDQTVTLNGVELSIEKVVAITPELMDAEGYSIGVAEQKLFLVRFGMKNTGEASATYRPQHDVTSAPDRTPMLFIWPDDAADQLKPTAVASIQFDGGLYTLGQLTDPNVTIPKGGKLTDEYIFEMPPSGAQNLMFTVPESIVGGTGKELARFLIPNKPDAILAPEIAALGKPITKGAAQVTIDKVNVEWLEVLPLEDEDAKKYETCPYGYTSSAVFKVDVSIKNTGSDTLVYSPRHSDNDSEDVKLATVGKGKSATITRLSVPPEAGVQLKGQLDEVDVKPGTTVKDFFVFERPKDSVKQLRLEMAGHIFDENIAGILIYDIPFSGSGQPPKPELKPCPEPTPPEGETPE